jgi:hypothetical protein
MGDTMPDLWPNDTSAAWRSALGQYTDVIDGQGVAWLPELDRWYRDELPDALAGRQSPHLTLPELVRLTEWKMARGVWRAPNLVLVRGNAPAAVTATSTKAMREAPHPTRPIATLATVAGIGPATASAVMAAAAPTTYPFFDELVAAQVPSLGTVAWTLGYYARYATALRDRATALGGTWTPVLVERALWAHVGGKAGR